MLEQIGFLLCRLRVISRNLSVVSKSNVLVLDDMSERANQQQAVIRVAHGKAMQTWNRGDFNNAINKTVWGSSRSFLSENSLDPRWLF